MTLAVQSHDEIRQGLLDAWSSNHRNDGEDLDVREDSAAYVEADAVALILSEVQLRSPQHVREIFPDTASESGALRHAALIGLEKKAATKARFLISATGTIGTAYATTDPLTTPNGQIYHPVSNSTLTTSPKLILVEAQTAGSAGNKAVGTILTWTPTVTNIDPTAPVSSDTTGAIVAVDTETTAELVARIVRWWQDRAGGGCRGDFVQWAESRAGVGRAFVYPIYHRALGGHTLGAVGIALMSAEGVQVPAASVTDVEDYLKGTGPYVLEGGKIAASVDDAPSQISVAGVTLIGEDVTIEVTLGPGFEFPFTGTFTTAAGSTTSTINLTTNPVGTISIGDLVAVQTGAVNGAYEVGEVATVTTGPNAITLVSPLTAAPAAAKLVRPACQNWEAMRDAVIEVFRALGPGDVNDVTFPKSVRWPPSSMRNPYTLYRSALVAAVMGVPGLVGAPAGVAGVISAEVTTPATDKVPPIVVPIAGVTTYYKLWTNNLVFVAP